MHTVFTDVSGGRFTLLLSDSLTGFNFQPHNPLALGTINKGFMHRNIIFGTRRCYIQGKVLANLEEVKGGLEWAFLQTICGHH